MKGIFCQRGKELLTLEQMKLKIKEEKGNLETGCGTKTQGQLKEQQKMQQDHQGSEEAEEEGKSLTLREQDFAMKLHILLKTNLMNIQFGTLEEWIKSVHTVRLKSFQERNQECVAKMAKLQKMRGKSGGFLSLQMHYCHFLISILPKGKVLLEMQENTTLPSKCHQS